MVSSLVSALTSWLRDPHLRVVITPGDDIVRLRSELDDMSSQVDQLRVRLQRTEALYGQEVSLNLSLEDELRSLGIRRRR